MLVKRLKKKARRELHDNVAYYLEQILQARLLKIVTAQPHTSHLTNHLGKMNKTGWALLKKQVRTNRQCSLGAPAYGCISDGRPG